MNPEIEKKEAALAEFRKSVLYARNLLEQIDKLDSNAYEPLYESLIMAPAKKWKELGSDVVQRSRYYHVFIDSSGTTWEKSPDLDLPGNLVFKHLRETVLPTLEAKLRDLRTSQNPA